MFDLQATVQPDPGQTITNFAFFVDGQAVTDRYRPQGLARTSVVTETGDAALCIDTATGKTTGKPGCKLVAGLPGNTAVLSQRAFSKGIRGVHELKVTAVQTDGSLVSAIGNFEIVGIDKDSGKLAKNIIVFLGDGMGAAHRTAARIIAKGYAQGKAKGLLTMDTFPDTGMVMTASLNSIVTETGDTALCIDADSGKTTGKSGCKLVAGLPGNAAVVSQRAYSKGAAGVHELKFIAQMSDGTRVSAIGNFEIIGVGKEAGRTAKNIIVFLGDGMSGLEFARRRRDAVGREEAARLGDEFDADFVEAATVRASARSATSKSSASTRMPARRRRTSSYSSATAWVPRIARRHASLPRAMRRARRRAC